MSASKAKPVILGREQILAAQDLQRSLEDVPEWGGSVYMVELTGPQRMAYNKAMTAISQDGEVDPEEAIRIMISMLADLIQDEEGNLLFTQDDVDALAKKSWPVLQRLSTAAMKLSGVSQEDLDEAVDEIKKARSANSSSPSPTSKDGQLAATPAAN